MRLRIFKAQIRSLEIAGVVMVLLAGINTGCAGPTGQPSKFEQFHPSKIALKIATGALPNGDTQSVYNTSLEAWGGTPPYTWNIQSGKMPDGLTLDSGSGTISGKPRSAGKSAVIFAVSDSSKPTHQIATTSLSLEIGSTAAQSLTSSGLGLPAGQVSQPYEAIVTAAGGKTPYTWSIATGNLPPGLALASTSGVISGTPNTDGMYEFALRVVDSSSTQQSTTETNSITISKTPFDPYGGLLSMPSPNPPTGMFRTEKFGNKWMLVDPDNNGLFMVGMYVLSGTGTADPLKSNYNARVTAKYGDSGPHWATSQLERIQSWGYNTVGPYASGYALPFFRANTWNTPDHSNPVKFPFIAEVRPSTYGMQNLNNWAPQPVKNILFGLSKFYTGYRPGTGVADYYDANFSIFLTNQLAHDPLPTAIKASPYKQYLIGMNTDDGDEMFGFGVGPDFRSGYSNSHLGWLVLVMSPVQSANSSKGFVYSDTTVYAKKELHDQLVAEYGTIDALNSAWGSNYTTFDSSGTSVNKTIGSGDGSTLSFSATLSETTVTPYSLQILVNGQAVAGDQGDGSLWGPTVSGSVNYASGAISLTFRNGNAPGTGAAIIVAFVQNGWGVGSGLLDEDGRPPHQSWTGIDFIALTDANETLKSDLDSFLFQIADHYFSGCRTAIQNWMPGVMYLGPDSLGTWGGPSNRNVLRAAAKSIDVMVMGGGPSGPLSQAMLDFIFTYYGDKPFYIGEFRVANPDSALFSYSAANSFATQGARGQDYFNAVTHYPDAAYSANGSRPYVGVFWWEYLDNPGEKNNWGLVSPSDNAYDGHEAVVGPGGVGTRSVACSPPLSSLLCGGEQRNYGDVISSVKSAHQKILQAVQQ